MTQGYGGLIFRCLVYTWVPVNNPDPSQRKHIFWKFSKYTVKFYVGPSLWLYGISYKYHLSHDNLLGIFYPIWKIGPYMINILNLMWVLNVTYIWCTVFFTLEVLLEVLLFYHFMRKREIKIIVITVDSLFYVNT